MSGQTDNDPKLAQDFEDWSRDREQSYREHPPLRDVVRWLNEHDYRVVKLEKRGGYLLGGSYVNPTDEVVEEL